MDLAHFERDAKQSDDMLTAWNIFIKSGKDAAEWYLKKLGYDPKLLDDMIDAEYDAAFGRGK